MVESFLLFLYRNSLFIMFLGITVFMISCNAPAKKVVAVEKDTVPEDPFIIYTDPSTLENKYEGFNSPKAINHIAEIENEYFNNYLDSVSRYYGTEWRNFAEYDQSLNDSLSTFDLYYSFVADKGYKADSMHCTIYAVEALKAGLDSTFDELNAYHRKIWKDREHAGWSIGYILTKYYGWKAYLFLSDDSYEYKRCKRYFKNNGTYYVWKQPDIPIEKVFDFDRDKDEIDSLLIQHEFGWGFSNQGLHTWITRFDMIKECNWGGSPSQKFDSYPTVLFVERKFIDYYDYYSHIIIFPPKKEKVSKS